MFFCDPCKIKNGWPGIALVSYGQCEMCDESAPCYDVPSKYLPVAKAESKPEYVGKHRLDRQK